MHSSLQRLLIKSDVHRCPYAKWDADGDGGLWGLVQAMAVKTINSLDLSAWK